MLIVLLFFSFTASRYSLPPPQHLTSQLLHSPSLPSTSREDNVQRDLARLFRPYHVPVGSGRGLAQRRRRETPWSHHFCCLPEPDALSVPKKEEVEFYETCGIGKKLITFNKNTGDHSYLSQHLYSAFPSLREAGGYTLAKSDRSKNLTIIPIPAAGYSLEYLRCRVDIKRAPLYIIPLQKSLTLNPSRMEVKL